MESWKDAFVELERARILKDQVIREADRRFLSACRLEQEEFRHLTSAQKLEACAFIANPTH